MLLKILIGMCSALVLFMVLWHPKDMDTKDLVITIPKGETTVGVFREQNSGTGMQDRPSGRSVGYSGETITRTAEVRASGVPDETDAEGTVASDEGYSGYDASTSEGEGVPDEVTGVDEESDTGTDSTDEIEVNDYYPELPSEPYPDMGDGEYTDYDSGLDESGATEQVTEEEDTTIAEEDATIEEEDTTFEPEDTTSVEKYTEEQSGWVYYGNCRITFYDDCEICCGAAGNTTASGVYPTSSHTVATGWDLPFGTELLIGDQVYVVEDRGVDSYCVDIFVDDHETALALGMYYADVYMR